MKRQPFGYLLSSVSLVKGFTMTIAVTAMAVGQLLADVQVAPGEVVMFPTLTLLVVGAFVVLWRNLKE